MIKAYEVQHPVLQKLKTQKVMPDEMILALNVANHAILNNGCFVLNVKQDKNISFDNMKDVENHIVNKMVAFVKQRKQEISIVTSPIKQ